MPPAFEKVVATNALTLRDTTVNRVKTFGQEVWMTKSAIAQRHKHFTHKDRPNQSIF